MGRLAATFDVDYVTAEGLPAAIPGAEVLLLWDFFSTAVAEVWDRCADLQWIHVAAAGVDTLLFDDLADSDVLVTNARGVFDRPIAEFVLASLLAFVKDIHRSHDLQRDRVWQHRETGMLQDRRVLVVGTGSIGRETARLLRAVGMQVSGVGRVARDDDPDFGRILGSDGLAEHVRGVPFLVNIAPLTPGTRGLIDAAVIDAMPGGFIVNVGRGPTVVANDLLAALRTGRLAGAALDVFDEEPLPVDHPAWTSRPTCPGTPSVGVTDSRPSSSTMPNVSRPADSCATWWTPDSATPPGRNASRRHREPTPRSPGSAEGGLPDPANDTPSDRCVIGQSPTVSSTNDRMSATISARLISLRISCRARGWMVTRTSRTPASR
jgi:phosphoglycerate dehydrogenase-like enzyme